MCIYIYKESNTDTKTRNSNCEVGKSISINLDHLVSLHNTYHVLLRAGNYLLQQSDPVADLWIALAAEHSYRHYSQSPEGQTVPSLINNQGESLYKKTEIFWLCV